MALEKVAACAHGKFPSAQARGLPAPQSLGRLPHGLLLTFRTLFLEKWPLTAPYRKSHHKICKLYFLTLLRLPVPFDCWVVEIQCLESRVRTVTVPGLGVHIRPRLGLIKYNKDPFSCVTKVRVQCMASSGG